MRIPKRLLEKVGAPLLATAALSCSGEPTSSSTHGPPLVPTPVAEEQVVDPVRYDPTIEAERLSRTDELFAQSETTRGRRIDEEDSARSRRASSTRLRHRPRDLYLGCGRG